MNWFYDLKYSCCVQILSRAQFRMSLVREITLVDAYTCTVHNAPQYYQMDKYLVPTKDMSDLEKLLYNIPTTE